MRDLLDSLEAEAMTFINAFGSSQIESWMVAKLFGSPGRSQDVNQTSGSTVKASQAAPPLLAGLSDTVAQALLYLKRGGTDASGSDVDPLQAAADHRAQSDARVNATLSANAAMTSTNVASAMYGAGIPKLSVEGSTISFASLIADEREAVRTGAEFVNQDPRFSEADRRQGAEQDVEYTHFLDQIETAYRNHTLVFQNAADVAGLDYARSNVASSAAGVQSSTGTETYNQDFYANRANKENSRMLDTGGGLTLYLTW